MKMGKEIYENFFADRVLKLSAALAYYTVFALPALLLLIISITGYFFGREAMEGKVFGQINDIVGDKAALQIQEAIQNIHLSQNTKLATIISVITLVLSASGIFGEIQDSINLIWGLKVKPRKGIIKMIINRLISFSLVLSIGFVLLVSLVVNGILAVVSNSFHRFLPGINIDVLLIFDYVLQFVVITLLFTVIFKVLPDAKIKWKDVSRGAVVTALLFLIGKFVLGYTLSRNTSITTYGAAGSLILILLWVYYSSIILYIGAEFTQSYATRFGSRIEPNRYAAWVNDSPADTESARKK